MVRLFEKTQFVIIRVGSASKVSCVCGAVVGYDIPEHWSYDGIKRATRACSHYLKGLSINLAKIGYFSVYDICLSEKL